MLFILAGAVIGFIVTSRKFPWKAQMGIDFGFAGLIFLIGLAVGSALCIGIAVLGFTWDSYNWFVRQPRKRQALKSSENSEPES